MGDEALSELGSDRQRELEGWRDGGREGCEAALAGDEGFSCSEQRPVIGSHVIQSKSTLNPVYLLFQSDMYAFLITVLSFLI